MQDKRGQQNIPVSKGKRFFIIFLSIFFFVSSVLGVLQLGCIYTEKSWKHFYPDYARVDLTSILKKTQLSDEDYEVLYRQTGLTKLGIDGFLERGDLNKILRVQNFFFKKQEVSIEHFNPFTYSEKINAHAPMARLEAGDIIVTATTRVSWWRYGHAALVVDGDNALIVESIAPSSSSEINHATDFDHLANFMILRPKLEAEVKAAVAAYAQNELLNIPYRFTVGILTKKFPEELKASQCAHLVWYAYKKFGYDLDSDGGGIVKPQDMALSEYVEVVQAYGFDLDTLWGK